MNLKEAFRFQNKLQSLMSDAQDILVDNRNTTKQEDTYLRSKVLPEAQDETVIEKPPTKYPDHMTELAGFLLHLLAEREKLAEAIRAAKSALPIDIDSQVSLNAKRQEIARLYKHMTDLRSSENVISNGGVGYRFDTDGNQVSYRCDVRRIVTINFDRNVIRRYASELNRRADGISAEIDRCMVCSAVDYTPPFDVNDTFGEVFEAYLEDSV